MKDGIAVPDSMRWQRWRCVPFHAGLAGPHPENFFPERTEVECDLALPGEIVRRARILRREDADHAERPGSRTHALHEVVHRLIGTS
jgi:hypothetical protein